VKERPVGVRPSERELLCCAPLADRVLSDDEAATLAGVMSALSDPVRLRIFSIVASEDEVCSCNLEELVGKSQPTISHHTHKLAAAGLIVGEKRGRWVWWRVVPEQMAALRAALGDGKGRPQAMTRRSR
jgi:ArsR family transcriptional regulator, arsenate/arsenite/antimonite-responsive transcriptional repressor